MKIKLIRDNLGRPRDDRDEKIYVSGVFARLALLKKLHEEVEEIANNQSDIYEYADVLELLYELGYRNGFSKDKIERAREQKRDRLGGFKKCCLLITTNHDNDK